MNRNIKAAKKNSVSLTVDRADPRPNRPIVIKSGCLVILRGPLISLVFGGKLNGQPPANILLVFHSGTFCDRIKSDIAWSGIVSIEIFEPFHGTYGPCLIPCLKNPVPILAHANVDRAA